MKSSAPESPEAAPALAGVAAELKTVAAGTSVFRQGDRSRGIFLLLAGCVRLRCAADGRYSVPGTLRDLAAELGLTQEALYRSLAVLERDGRLSRSGSLLHVRIGRK